MTVFLTVCTSHEDLNIAILMFAKNSARVKWKA
jgi:hypothetical protein